MRRVVILVLAVIMLMSVCALAEQDIIRQDEMPPMVVKTVNEDGEIIIAKICDAEGNVVAEIKETAMILTDVNHRQDAGIEIVVTRLTGAYNGVMEDVHLADVECKLHDHDLKVDINAVLSGMDGEMNAHDLVMYELFDVMLTEEEAALMVDGNYLEVTFELIESHQDVPLITMFTGDGVEWMVLPTSDAGENRFTVQMPTLGTLALLSDGRDTIGIGSSVQRVVVVIPGIDGSAYEDVTTNFTPSVSGKPAPEMITFEGKDGEIYVGYIRNQTGDVEVQVPDKNYILVTSVAERNYIVDIQTHEHLEWSYDSIVSAEDVGELFTDHDESVDIPEHEHGTIAGQLDEVLAKMGLDLKHDDLVVKDLFEVSAYGNYLQHLYDDTYYLEVTFDANLKPGKPLVVIHSADSLHWHVHDPADVIMNADGTVTLRMHDLGTVAFLVEAEEKLDPETAVQSPN